MRRRTTDVTLPPYDIPSDAPLELMPPAEIVARATGERGRAFDERLTSWLLRAGLAFVLSYAAFSSVIHPETFAPYFPSFMPAEWASELLPVFAGFEALLALGLMTDRYAYVASVLAGLTLVAIIAVSPNAFDVLFRNVAIACAAFALAVQTRRERRHSTSS